MRALDGLMIAGGSALEKLGVVVAKTHPQSPHGHRYQNSRRCATDDLVAEREIRVIESLNADDRIQSSKERDQHMKEQCTHVFSSQNGKYFISYLT
jgi:hypothetical protein